MYLTNVKIQELWIRFGEISSICGNGTTLRQPRKRIVAGPIDLIVKII
jgi:hypothetical protein